jgi:hypothetical protein
MDVPTVRTPRLNKEEETNTAAPTMEVGTAASRPWSQNLRSIRSIALIRRILLRRLRLLVYLHQTLTTSSMARDRGAALIPRRVLLHRTTTIIVSTVLLLSRPTEATWRPTRLEVSTPWTRSLHLLDTDRQDRSRTRTMKMIA